MNVNEWKLDGLPQLSDAAANAAPFIQTLLVTADWQSAFSGSLGGLTDFSKEVFKQRAQALKTRHDELAKANRAKADEAQSEVKALQEEALNVTSPAAAPADPDRYVASVRVSLEDKPLGLPGVLVRIPDPKNKKQSLADGATDSEGNLVLTLEKEQVDRVGAGGNDLSIEVASPGGKVVYRQDAALSPKLNRSDTLMISVKTSADLKQNIAAATERKEGRDARIASLQQDVERLQSELAGQQAEIQNRLDLTNNLLKTFSKPGRQKGK
jgi:hypothetical protein